MAPRRSRGAEASWFDSHEERSYERPRVYSTTSSIDPRRASSRNCYSSRTPYRENRGSEETSRQYVQDLSRTSEFSYTSSESNEPPRCEKLKTAYAGTTIVHHFRIVRDREISHRKGTREHMRRRASFERHVRGLPLSPPSGEENLNRRSPRSESIDDTFGAGSDEYHEWLRQETSGGPRPNSERAKPRVKAPETKKSQNYSHSDRHDRNGGPSNPKWASIDPSSSRIPQSTEHNSPRKHYNQFRSEHPATSSRNHMTSYTERLRSEHQPCSHGLPNKNDPYDRFQANRNCPGCTASNGRLPAHTAQPHRPFHPKPTPGSPPPPPRRSSPPPPFPPSPPNNTTLPDHYAVLALPPHAPAADIKRAARQKRVEYHPDRLKKAGMSDREKRRIDEMAMRVGMAADVLGDEGSRREYDLLRARMGLQL